MLAKAVAAYRDALKVRTHEDLPQQWAETQNNLGTTIARQAISTGATKGAALLPEAATCFHNALKVYTREHLT